MSFQRLQICQLITSDCKRINLTAATWLLRIPRQIARKAYVRLRDVSAVDLVTRVEAGVKQGQRRELLLAQVAAHQSKFQEAAKLYTAAGKEG